MDEHHVPYEHQDHPLSTTSAIKDAAVKGAVSRSPIIKPASKAAKGAKTKSAKGKARKDVIMLCHGGPIATPQDAAYVLGRTKACDGFYGASSMERLPTEIALTEQTRQFKSIGRNRAPRRVR